MYRRLKHILKKEGIITRQLQNEYFQGMNFKMIRKKLAELGLDPHTCIELESTEIALVTPKGILMQVRNYVVSGEEHLNLAKRLKKELLAS